MRSSVRRNGSSARAPERRATRSRGPSRRHFQNEFIIANSHVSVKGKQIASLSPREAVRVENCQTLTPALSPRAMVHTHRNPESIWPAGGFVDVAVWKTPVGVRSFNPEPAATPFHTGPRRWLRV